MSIAAILGKKYSCSYYSVGRERQPMSTVAILDCFMSVGGIGRCIFFLLGRGVDR